ncbi:hypothetical protein NDU88_006548 [Pleurodeles waltl]|uniref:Uncharacterized protein n=1 Tax=Pleurodeles waltl TaxID=8319 RepID=A0AAV7LPG8_PLEWA|nr:hypothetical protein NDU88_006548 [Pleurodeles waltl]
MGEVSPCNAVAASQTPSATSAPLPVGSIRAVAEVEGRVTLQGQPVRASRLTSEWGQQAATQSPPQLGGTPRLEVHSCPTTVQVWNIQPARFREQPHPAQKGIHRVGKPGLAQEIIHRQATKPRGRCQSEGALAVPNATETRPHHTPAETTGGTSRPANLGPLAMRGPPSSGTQPPSSSSAAGKSRLRGLKGPGSTPGAARQHWEDQVGAECNKVSWVPRRTGEKWSEGSPAGHDDGFWRQRTAGLPVDKEGISRTRMCLFPEGGCRSQDAACPVPHHLLPRATVEAPRPTSH